MAKSYAFPLPNTWRRADVLLASLFINLLGLALPIVILQVYDRIIPNAAFSTFQILILGLVAALVLNAALTVLRAAIVSAVGARYEHRMGMATFCALLDSDYIAFSKESAGTYSDRIHSLMTVRDFYAGGAALVVIDLPFACLFLILVGFIGGWLVFVPLTLVVMIACLGRVLGEELGAAVDARTETDRRRYNFLVETLQGIHTIKALAMERLMVRRYERLQGQSAQEVMNLSALHAISSNLANTVSQLGMVSFVALGSFSVIDQSMTVGGLAAGTMLTGRVLQPALRALNFWTRWQSVQKAEAKLQSVFMLPHEAGIAADVPELKGHIKFNNVSFRHSDSSPYILKDVDLDIPAGSTIGVTGENGCGMSTFLSLISGIQEPTKGSITIDGLNVRELRGPNFRKQIGVMPEHGSFFNGTLLENITMFRDGEAKVNAIKAIQALNLDDFVIRQPKGLETHINGGMIQHLSKGIQQQILIARALAEDPTIILFDNAHSGLDMEADHNLKGVMQGLHTNKTVVVATYRPSFLNICDHVYELKGGKPVERPVSPPPEEISSSQDSNEETQNDVQGLAS